MIPQLLAVGLWSLAAYLTVQKHGMESLPIVLFLFVIVLIGSAGGATATDN